MRKPYSTRQIKALAKTLGLEVLNAHDIKINGAFRGTSGFISNPKRTAYLYFNTESSCLETLADKVLLRSAKDERDWVGGRNMFIDTDKVGEVIHKFFLDVDNPHRNNTGITPLDI